MKLEGLEAMTSKQVDDMEKNLLTAEMRHSKVKEGHDVVRKQLLDLQAGVEHLHGKLSEIKLEAIDENTTNVNNVSCIT